MWDRLAERRFVCIRFFDACLPKSTHTNFPHPDSGELHHSSSAQVSVRARDGAALTLLGSRRATTGAPATPLAAGLRFDGARLPAVAGLGGAAAAAEGAGGAVVGVVGAAPLGDAFVVSAWAEGRPGGHGGDAPAPGGAAGWGVGLHSQPDDGGQAVGLVLARPAGEGGAAAPLLCELSCRVPLADGLELVPGALVVRAAGAGTATALRFAANWRF
jgi:hypothetical protein